MKLFLLRHGMTATAGGDAERALTVDGIAALKDVMGRRVDELSNVRKIFTGPLGRIQETASIAAEAIGYTDEIIENNSLNKLSRARDIIPTIENIDMDAGDIMLVSHESSLCNMMLWVTLEDILMSNSSLSAIETNGWQRGVGKLLWQESPNSSEIKHARSFADMF